MLVGRDAECARLEHLLADARNGRSAVLVLRGAAGVGKTALLQHAAGHAGSSATRWTRGVESEIEVPYSSLLDLVRPDLDLLETLPPPQAAAMAGALALGPAVAGDRLSVAAATLALLAASAERAGGLLVLVDDAQWLDLRSAEAVLFAARRVDAEGVVMLLAVRDGEPVEFDASTLPDLHLAGLSREEAHALLARGGPVAPEVGERLFRATAGNPLALTELAATTSAAVLAGEEPLDEPVRVGRRVEDAFVRRVAALPDPTRDCLLLAAASDTQSLVTIAAAAADAGIGLEELAPAEAAGLVALDGHRLEFEHPLLRSAIYHAAPPAARRRAHRAVARVLADDEIDRRAWHLARATAGPDEEVARGLEAAALAGRTRAGPGGGARAFERAARLSADPEARARRLVEAARDRQLAGHPERSLRLLREAVSATSDARVRADAALLRARAEVWAGQPGWAFDTLLAEAARMEAVDPTRAAVLLTDAAVVATMRGQYATEVEAARAARAAAERGGDAATVVAADVVLAHGLTNTGRGPEAEAILQRAERSVASSDPLAGGPLLQLAGFTWMCLEDYQRATRFLDRAIGRLRAAGAFGALPFLLACRSMVAFRTGRWVNAHAAAWEAVRVAGEGAHESESTFYLACLARIEAGLGREQDCREHAGRAVVVAERFGVDSGLPWAEAALGLLELGQGRPEDAIAPLERVASLADRMGIGEPGLVQWAPDLVEACVWAGRRDQAGEVLARLEHQAEVTGRVWAHATAARCRGLLAADDAFEAHFTTALRRLAATTMPFEVARTQLCLGERLGRARRRTEARRPLRSALDTFERLGAAPWAERARAELARNGGRTQLRAGPGLEVLTPQELQVALAVADGATNKEAAAGLFLSPKTIEFHLGNAYRKLHVRSRTELARLLER